MDNIQWCTATRKQADTTEPYVLNMKLTNATESELDTFSQKTSSGAVHNGPPEVTISRTVISPTVVVVQYMRISNTQVCRKISCYSLNDGQKGWCH